MAGAAPPNAASELERESSEELDVVHAVRRMSRSRETLGEVSFLKAPQSSITHRQEKEGITWYTVQVKENDEERTYFKRYSDFKELEKQLRASAAIKSIPELPTSGVLGLRHRLDIGDFNQKRQDGLQTYVRALFEQVVSVAEEPALDHFFARETASHISFKSAPSDARAKMKSLQDSILDHLGGGSGATDAAVLRTTTDAEAGLKRSFGDKDLLGEGEEVASQQRALLQEGIGLACKKGHKIGQPNQDSLCVIRQAKKFCAFGVFDGHGPLGHDISDFAASYVMKLLVGHSARDSMPEEALRFAFIETQNMIDELTRIGEIKGLESGSTGTVAILPADRNVIFVAHVGDSRTVLCRSRDGDTARGEAVDLTNDHKPTLEKEKKRIEATGGQVKFDGMFNHRVWTADGRGGLCVSRVLGDGMLHPAGVIAVPETSMVPIDAISGSRTSGRDLFVLMCSDGVWEFLSSQEACDIVLKHGRGDVQGAVEELVRISHDKWMEDSEGEVTDDITAILVWL